MNTRASVQTSKQNDKVPPIKTSNSSNKNRHCFVFTFKFIYNLIEFYSLFLLLYYYIPNLWEIYLEIRGEGKNEMNALNELLNSYCRSLSYIVEFLYRCNDCRCFGNFLAQNLKNTLALVFGWQNYEPVCNSCCKENRP